MSAEILLVFFVATIALVGGGILFAAFVSPRSFNIQKSEAYECGIPTSGITWLQFNVGYYLFAILFLIFDVEIVFLFPWAAVMREVGIVGFIEIIIFFLILVLGLAYAWKKHALVWQ